MGVDDSSGPKPSNGLEPLLQTEGSFVLYSDAQPLTIGIFFDQMMRIYEALDTSFQERKVQVKYLLRSPDHNTSLAGSEERLPGLRGMMSAGVFDTYRLAPDSHADFQVQDLGTLALKYAEGWTRKRNIVVAACASLGSGGVGYAIHPLLGAVAGVVTFLAAYAGPRRLERCRSRATLSYTFKIADPVTPDEAADLARTISFFREAMVNGCYVLPRGKDAPALPAKAAE